MKPTTPNKSLTGKTLKIFWDHSKKYPWSMSIITVGSLIGVATELYTRFLYKDFFDVLGLNDKTLAHSLVTIIVKVLVVALIGWVGYRSATWATNIYESKVMRDLIESCFAYLHKHSYSFFNNNFSGSLQRKVSRFSRAFENLADLLIWQLSLTVIRVLAIIIIILVLFPSIGWGLVVWSIIFVAFNYWFYKYKLQFDLEKAAADTRVSGYLADTIVNNSNIKLYSGYVPEITGFRALVEKWRHVTRISWDLDLVSQAIQSTLFIIVQFYVFYFGIKLWQVGRLSLGDFVLIQSYILLASDNLWNLGRYFKTYYENMADANEMTEILLQKHEVADVPDAKSLVVSAGEVDFKEAHFGYYQAQNVFDNFNLKITGGERVALIGPSGGGKSTIVKLLFRFFDLQSGQILIDGQDISQITQDSLRENIALVPQDPILFHRSILDNIRYAKQSATEEEVIAVAKLAHCHEFISKFPEKYETFVGERGIKLSGGERQRIAIARAILKNAPILVLDEATSSLDSESEMFIQEALKNLMVNKTTIVIAHRLSTIMQMDRIIVLENGTVVEQGKHKELLKLNKGTYQKLWEIQAGGFSTGTVQTSESV